MKAILALVLLVFLSGCAQYPAESRRAYAYRVCEESAVYPDSRHEFMRQCMAMELSQLSMSDILSVGSSVPWGFSTGYLGAAPFGAPNAIGPYGTLGPTWQQFNTPYQQMVTPDPLALTPMIHPGHVPVNPRYLYPY